MVQNQHGGKRIQNDALDAIDQLAGSRVAGNKVCLSPMGGYISYLGDHDETQNVGGTHEGFVWIILGINGKAYSYLRYRWVRKCPLYKRGKAHCYGYIGGPHQEFGAGFDYGKETEREGSRPYFRQRSIAGRPETSVEPSHL